MKSRLPKGATVGITICQSGSPQYNYIKTAERLPLRRQISPSVDLR